MATMTVRDALRDAMAEEMRRDDASSSWAKRSPNIRAPTKSRKVCCRNSAPKRVIDTPITEHGFAGLGVGAAFAACKPIVEFMTFNFAMQAIDQIINSAAKTLYMSGGQMGCRRVPWAERRRGARRRAAQPGLLRLVFARAGSEGDRALYRRRCQRPA